MSTRRKLPTRWRILATNRDLWPDHLRGWLMCSWLGHRFTRRKMYGALCDRCSAFRPL